MVLPQEFAFQHPVSPGGDWPPIIGTPDDEPAPESSGVSSKAWPVGSVFLSVVSTSPATLLGFGSWSQIAVGQFLVGLNAGDTDYDTPEEQGGSLSGSFSGSTGSEASHTHSTADTTGGPSSTVTVQSGSGANPGASGHTHSFSGNSGSGTSHSHSASGSTFNQPPYFVVYAWKRIA